MKRKVLLGSSLDIANVHMAVPDSQASQEKQGLVLLPTPTREAAVKDAALQHDHWVVPLSPHCRAGQQAVLTGAAWPKAATAPHGANACEGMLQTTCWVHATSQLFR
jgi:hypothetical protein